MTEYESLVLDLCSGLGGASQAFDSEMVVKVDIQKSVKPTIVADVQNLPFKTDLKPDLTIFSPPCNCFSVVQLYRHWNHHVPGPEAVKAIQLVKQGMNEIRRLNPRFWIMENPVGMLRTVIGKPPHTIRMTDYGGETKKPTDLWGNVPFPMLKATKPWPKSPRGTRNTPLNRWYRRHLGESSEQRSMWPYGLSETVRDSVFRNHTNSTREAQK